ncbi:zf-HC2 domain-containing protein [Actinosynnema sp. NPDC020468]|uniref:anti-sigma factor family protein n=1 Tax=Actinosynnema sp. NPDC020468 TaxID=3154488 RepID=UPI0034089D81
MSCNQTVALGAYLLGSLEPGDRSTFERHLGTGCDTCRREMIRLAPLPGLLSQVRLEDVLDPLVEVPDVVEPLPPGEADEADEPVAGRRRRWPLLVGAAVLVVVLVGALVATWPKPAAPDQAVTWRARDGGTGVSAEADLVRKSWGTELWVSMRNVPKDARCKLVVHDRDGRTEVGGWWGTDHAEDERIPGSTSFPFDRIERLDVVVDMQVLVSVRP